MSTGRIPSWLAPTSADPDVARRQFVLGLMVAGLFLLGIGWMAADFIARTAAGDRLADLGVSLFGYLYVVVGLSLALVAYWLSRAERVALASYILIFGLLAAATWITWRWGIEIGDVALYFLPIVLAGLLLGEAASLATATVALLLYIAVGLFQQMGIIAVPLVHPLLPSVLGFGMVIYLVAGLNWIGNRHLSTALQEARQQAAELRAARKEQALLLTDLQAQTEQQAHLLRAVEDLAAPVIVIHDQIIALPLVGQIDEHRAQLVRRGLLQGIADHRARIALLDLTGMPQISRETVQHLEAMSQAGRLLGAEVLLVGIHAEAAAEIIRAGVDLRSLQTGRNLQSGIEWALARMGKRIVNDG